MHLFQRFVKLSQISSANTKFSKTELSKTAQLGGFLNRLLGPLLKTGLTLIGNVLKSLTKNVLVPLELTATASAIGKAIQKKLFGSGTTTLIFSNKDLSDIMKIVKSLKDSGLFTKELLKLVKNRIFNDVSSFNYV